MMSKRKKVKLPKRIAGVKIPKAARKGPVADFLNSSGGQVLLAEALVLAAGVFGVRRMASPSGVSGDFGMREHIAEASGRLSYACGEALRAFRAALEESAPMAAAAAEEADVAHSEELPEPRDDEVVTVAKKKRATSRSETAPAMS
jgi:hypothetical protein